MRDRKEEMNMNILGKVLLLVLVIAYVISPIDLCPGPIDDIIILVLTFASRKKIDVDNYENGRLLA